MRHINLPIILLVVFFIGFAVVNNRKLSTFKTDEQTPRRPIMTNEKQEQKEKSPTIKMNSSNPKLDTNITPTELQSFRDSLPSLETIREEAQKAPHSPPESLINFAKGLGPLMEKALKNITDAELLSNELQDCSVDESIIQSARATCVTSVERLAERHPKLIERAEKIKKNVAPDVKNLLNNRDLQLRK